MRIINKIKAERVIEAVMSLVLLVLVKNKIHHLQYCINSHLNSRSVCGTVSVFVLSREAKLRPNHNLSERLAIFRLSAYYGRPFEMHTAQ